MEKELQLEILLRTKVLLKRVELDEGSTRGLCFCLEAAILDVTGFEVGYGTLKKIIPLFTEDNAFEFGANPYDYDGYWWKPKDPNRMEFLDWMVKCLKI